MLKIQRVVEAGVAVLALSGRIENEDLPQLEALITAERKGVVLDLKEVTLVARDAVNFLTRWEEKGIRMRACPAYVREWITKERREK